MLWTLRMCALRLPLCENFIEQKLQAYGFWPVCLKLWVSKDCF